MGVTVASIPNRIDTGPKQSALRTSAGDPPSTSVDGDVDIGRDERHSHGGCDGGHPQ
jgi:hypothetical protein